MILGIDASSIRAGGGVTHLVELLRAAEPAAFGFSKVVVWGGSATLGRIESRPWLVKSHQTLLDRNLAVRTLWQSVMLSGLARRAKCDVLFVPGGSYAGTFRPMVTFNQNLLPFELRELRRFGWSWQTLKGLLLRWTQGRSFKRADGLIFLTEHARDIVMEVIGKTAGPTQVIPHGIDPRFSAAPRLQLPIDRYTFERPFRLLYVSIVNVYKHQWHVAEAVARLRADGWPVSLDIVGPAYGPALDRLKNTLQQLDPTGAFVKYRGSIPYDVLHQEYVDADLFVFASSCETFGQIVTEAMACGLPIACSNRAAMPELLGDAGVYFDPENPHDIACALKELIGSPERRTTMASAAIERSHAYSWQRCAADTFKFVGGSVPASVRARKQRAVR